MQSTLKELQKNRSDKWKSFIGHILSLSIISLFVRTGQARCEIMIWWGFCIAWIMDRLQDTLKAEYVLYHFKKSQKPTDNDL
jgi:hypothetical protein